MTSCYRDFIKTKKFKHVTFHGLQHTHATHLFESNVHPKIVSERLGHSTIKIALDLYSHVLPTIQESVTASITETMNGVNDKTA